MERSTLSHKLLMLYSGMVRLVMTPALDEVPLFRRLRGFLYGRGAASCGPNFQVSSNAVLWGLEHLHVGRDVYVGPGVVVICLDRVSIGDGVLLGPNVVISNGNHVFREGAYRVAENVAAPVVIGPGSWIGAGAVLLAGITIGRGVLVAANAAVTKDAEDFQVIGGVPARPIGAARPQVVEPR
jgi:maltose O-acetyltransferase